MNNKRSEYRSIKFETRTEEQDGEEKLYLRGYAILFNTETPIYDYWLGEIKETILPTALDNTDLTDVYLLVGHDSKSVLGRTGVNLKLEVDDTGLFFECEIPRTQLAQDIYTLVKMGILDGMSFGFVSHDQPNSETKVRTITQIDELFEITITPFPAYKEATLISQSHSKNEQPKEENLEGSEDQTDKDEQESLVEELEELLNE